MDLCRWNVLLVSFCSLFLLKSEALLEENPQYGLNVAFYSKVTRSCDKVIYITLN